MKLIAKAEGFRTSSSPSTEVLEFDDDLFAYAVIFRANSIALRAFLLDASNFALL